MQKFEDEATNDAMLIARPLKPRRLSIATTASGSVSFDEGWGTQEEEFDRVTPVRPFFDAWARPMPPSPGYVQRAPFLSSGPPTPSGQLSGDASQRVVEEDLVSKGLSLLHMLLSGPSIPALPPCGCYGGLEVSSAISEALGTQAAAAKAAADGHGDKPVKVLLPWYPEVPTLVADHTRPAKLPDPETSGTAVQWPAFAVAPR